MLAPPSRMRVPISKSSKLFGVKFLEIHGKLFDTAFFYTKPENHLPYSKVEDKVDIKLWNYSKKDYVVYQNHRFDCFSFVWMVLQKLIAQRVIQSDIDPEVTILNTISSIHLAITKGYFAKLDLRSDTLKSGSCGIIFLIKSYDGWETQGHRHLAFYFVNTDSVIWIHNSRTQRGVCQTIFTKDEFYDKMSHEAEVYITTS